MRTPSPFLAYKEASTQQASPVGLVILLYDGLVRDLKNAVSAMHAGNIEERCRSLKHGFVLLQQLELLLDAERGGVTAEKLRRFYRHLRGEMLKAQFERSPARIERQVALILDVREAWQTLDAPTSAEAREVVPAEERRAFSCSA